MLRKALVAVLIATSPSAVALAQETPPAAEAPKKEKKICRRQVATGSIMPRSVCRTQAQWDELSERAKSDLDRTRELERGRSLVEGNRGS